MVDRIMPFQGGGQVQDNRRREQQQQQPSAGGSAAEEPIAGLFLPPGADPAMRNHPFGFGLNVIDGGQNPVANLPQGWSMRIPLGSNHPPMFGEIAGLFSSINQLGILGANNGMPNFALPQGTQNILTQMTSISGWLGQTMDWANGLSGQQAQGVPAQEAPLPGEDTTAVPGAETPETTTPETTVPGEEDLEVTDIGEEGETTVPEEGATEGESPEGGSEVSDDQYIEARNNVSETTDMLREKLEASDDPAAAELLEKLDEYANSPTLEEHEEIVGLVSELEDSGVLSAEDFVAINGLRDDVEAIETYREGALGPDETDGTDSPGDDAEPTDGGNTDEAAAIDYLRENFADIDEDGNEHLNAEELRSVLEAEGFSDDVISGITDNLGVLERVNGVPNDPPDTVTINDLNAIADELASGKTIDEIVSGAEDGEDSEADAARQKEIEAIQLLREHVEGIPSDGSYNENDIRLAIAETDDPEVQDLLYRIAENQDNLSYIDGESGDLNAEELDTILDLLERGHSLDFLINEGRIIDEQDLQGGSTLRDNDQPVMASEDKKAKQLEAIQILIDHVGDVPADESFNDEDILRASEFAEDPEVRQILVQMARNKDGLSELDGEGGDLNAEELNNIKQLFEEGYDLNFLIREGELSNEYQGFLGSDRESSLLHHHSLVD